jgi:hypothetical protein
LTIYKVVTARAIVNTKNYNLKLTGWLKTQSAEWGLHPPGKDGGYPTILPTDPDVSD